MTGLIMHILKLVEVQTTGFMQNLQMFEVPQRGMLILGRYISFCEAWEHDIMQHMP